MTMLDTNKIISKMPSIETQFIKWIELSVTDSQNTARNLWLERAGFKVYVRRSRLTINGIEYSSLDIANIEIPKQKRGRGWFKCFRKIVESLNPWEVTHYENLLNQDLILYFEKERLLKILPSPNTVPSFIIFNKK